MANTVEIGRVGWRGVVCWGSREGWATGLMMGAGGVGVAVLRLARTSSIPFPFQHQHMNSTTVSHLLRCRESQKIEHGKDQRSNLALCQMVL